MTCFLIEADGHVVPKQRLTRDELVEFLKETDVYHCFYGKLHNSQQVLVYGGGGDHTEKNPTATEICKHSSQNLYHLYGPVIVMPVEMLNEIDEDGAIAQY